MNTHKRMQQGLLSALLISTIACTGILPGQHQQTGSLKFQFQFPSTLRQGFAVQAIPNQTKRFKVEISGENLSTAIVKTINMDLKDNKQNYKAESIPVGKKKVTVTAYDDLKGLSAASKDVTIEAGKTTGPVEFDLQSILKSFRISLPRSMPIEVKVMADLTGTGIDSGKTLNLQQSLAKGSTTANFTDVPEGDKELKIRLGLVLPNQKVVESAAITKPFSVKSNGDLVISAPIERDFAVSQAGNAEINLSILEIATAFQPKATELLAAFALSPELFDQLAQALPELGLRPGTPTPGPSQPNPSATPSNPAASPSPVPSPSASLINLKLEATDGGVQVNQPGGPLNTPPETIPFPDGPITLRQWTKLLKASARCHYNGPDKPKMELLITNLNKTDDPLNALRLPAVAAEKVADNLYQGIQAFPVLPGIFLNTVTRYKIEAKFSAAAGCLTTKKEFLIEVVPFTPDPAFFGNGTLNLGNLLNGGTAPSPAPQQ